jgi:hypothetical protein
VADEGKEGLDRAVEFVACRYQLSVDKAAHGSITRSGVRRHFRQPALAQELIDARPYSVHRETGVLLKNSKAYRIRGDVGVTAVFDEAEDAVVVEQPLHAVAG